MASNPTKTWQNSVVDFLGLPPYVEDCGMVVSKAAMVPFDMHSSGGTVDDMVTRIFETVPRGGHPWRVQSSCRPDHECS